MAFALNGTSQYFTSAAALTPQVNFSVFLRFKAASLTGNQMLFCAGDTVIGSQNYILLLGGTELWVGSYMVSGGAAKITGLSLSTGVWYSILGVWGATNQRIIYDGSTRVTDTTTITTVSTNRAQFGAEIYQGGIGGYFSGSIADMAIWGSALLTDTSDLNQVQGLFSGGVARKFRPAVLTDNWPAILPAGNANGIRGTVLTATNSNTEDRNNPRLYP